MDHSRYNSSKSQLKSLRAALKEIQDSGSLTINGLLNDIARLDPKHHSICNPSSIYRFLEKSDDNATLRYDIAAPIYEFLCSSRKYSTLALSVFNKGRPIVEHSVFYELRSFLSAEREIGGHTPDILSLSQCLVGRYEMFRRPWMLARENRDTFIMRTELNINMASNGQVVVANEQQKYDGGFGGQFAVRETDSGYILSFGRQIVIFLKSGRGTTVSFFLIDSCFPEISLNNSVDVIRGSVLSSKGQSPHQSYPFIARRTTADVDIGVIAENTLSAEDAYIIENL